MIVWGGNEYRTPGVNDGAIYNPATNTWRTMTTAGAPLGRMFHSGVWTGTAMFIWGGYYNNGVDIISLNDGGIYVP